MADTATRLCPHCGVEKPISGFYVCRQAKSDRSYVKTRCKECHRQYPRDRKNDNLRNRYGITSEQWRAIRAKENHQCMICGISEHTINRPLMVDHCHRNKRVRGVLCQHCNTMLGMAKDKIRVLRAAIQYLKTNKRGYKIPHEIPAT